MFTSRKTVETHSPIEIRSLTDAERDEVVGGNMMSIVARLAAPALKVDLKLKQDVPRSVIDTRP